MEASAAATEYAAGLQEAFPNLGTEEFPQPVQWGTTAGRRFDRITKTWGGQRSVHAFVERATGHVYKAEGWKAPAKGVRFTSVQEALEAAKAHPAGWAGGYLYSR